MEYTENVIKFTCCHFNRKWNFAWLFLEFLFFSCARKCKNTNGYNSPTGRLFA